MAKTFRDLGVDEQLADELAAGGITHPFPIQELTLPLALAGNDLIGQARTGTGKTLAFGLPLLQRLDVSRSVTQALVVVPTRELCLQVFDDLKIGARIGVSSISVYGGVGYEDQTRALRSGAHVVVGTPGRLLDHLNRGNLDLSHVSQLVLDEADEMLDMGFLPDVERLIQACPTDRHTMLFSATMPTAIVKLARRYLDHPTFTRADTELHETAPTVEQHFLQVHRMDKPRVLARILQSPGRGGVYVFVRTKHMADRLVHDLEELGIPAIPIHGDLRQESRERNLDRFRSGKATVLVATEVAARGLDVTGVTHVINYDCPDDEKMYLHRIGRTARAGEAGVAVTFAEFNEVDRLSVIRKAVGATDTPLEQVFSTSEALTERFNLPDETPWAGRTRRTSTRDTDAAGARRGGGPTQKRDRGAGGDEDRRDTRRRGRTDGRPKSARRAEGAGGDHDAAPPERSSSGGRQRARTRTREQPPPGAAREVGDAAAPRAEAPSDRPPRSRRRSGDGHARIERSTGRDAPSESAEARPDAGGAADERRERADDQREAADAPQAPRAGKRSRAGSTAASRPKADRAGRAEQAGDGDDDRKPRRQPDPHGSERSRTSDRGRGSTAKGSGGRGGRRGDVARSDVARSEPAKLASRGRDARGEGQPQLARRVKVEHLP